MLYSGASAMMIRIQKKLLLLKRGIQMIPDEQLDEWARLKELALRLVAEGPMCYQVSCSETHEISDGIFELISAVHELKFVIEVIEWEGYDGVYMIRCCPWCGSPAPNSGFESKHEPDCIIAEVLK